MRVVVDTNVIVSAVLKTTSIPALVVGIIQTRGTLLKSQATEDEIRQVLVRPKLVRYLLPSVQAWLDDVLASAELVHVTERIALSRDPKDDKFLELAASGYADLIVSGDADLLALRTFREKPIVTPAMFMVAAQRHDAP
jgi:putative PIN family toxin of toxin-antitoxin system